jgi:glycosyltransferase involved in cell wall biosynthesis
MKLPNKNLNGCRILLAAEYIQYGGTRTYVKDLLRFYSEAGAYVHLVTSYSGSDEAMAALVESYGFKLTTFKEISEKSNPKLRNSVATVWSRQAFNMEVSMFKKFMSQNNLERSVISVGTSGLFLSATHAGIKPIMIAHGYPHGLKQKFFGSTLMAKLLPSDIKIITMSDFARKAFMNSWSMHPSKPTIQTLYSTCGARQESLPITARRNRILTAALVESHKRPFDWVKIATKVQQMTDIADLEFMWLGEGPLRQDVIESVEQLGLSRTTFPGWSDSPSSYYRDSKVYLQTSSKESLGLSVIDAMRYGIPAVTTAAGGLPEVVSNGITGFVVPIGDTSAAASALEELLSDTTLWMRQSKAAFESYQDKFSPEKWCRDLMEVH